MKVLIISFFLISCSRIVIDTRGYRGNIDMEPRFKVTHRDNDSFPNLQNEKNIWSYWAGFKAGKVNLSSELKKKNPRNEYIHDFVITTKFTGKDILKSLYPFGTSRTIIYKGFYLRDKKSTLQVK